MGSYPPTLFLSSKSDDHRKKRFRYIGFLNVFWTRQPKILSPTEHLISCLSSNFVLTPLNLITTERNTPNIKCFLMFFGRVNQTSYLPPNILSPSFFARKKENKTKKNTQKKQTEKKNDKKNTHTKTHKKKHTHTQKTHTQKKNFKKNTTNPLLPKKKTHKKKHTHTQKKKNKKQKTQEKKNTKMKTQKKNTEKKKTQKNTKHTHTHKKWEKKNKKKRKTQEKKTQKKKKKRRKRKRKKRGKNKNTEKSKRKRKRQKKNTKNEPQKDLCRKKGFHTPNSFDLGRFSRRHFYPEKTENKKKKSCLADLALPTLLCQPCLANSDFPFYNVVFCFFFLCFWRRRVGG